MTLATNSGQFVQVFRGSTEITQYFDTANWSPDRKQTDVTTMAALGGPVTKNNLRGALKVDLALSGPYDPLGAKIMRQDVGGRIGSLYTIYAGANNLPGQGDQLYTAYLAVFNFVWNRKAGSPITITYNLMIPDGALAVPVIGQI